MKNLGQDSWYLIQDLNHVPPKYKSKMLLLDHPV
jgi:hypothetical protein